MKVSSDIPEYPNNCSLLKPAAGFRLVIYLKQEIM